MVKGHKRNTIQQVQLMNFIQKIVYQSPMFCMLPIIHETNVGQQYVSLITNDISSLYDSPYSFAYIIDFIKT